MSHSCCFISSNGNKSVKVVRSPQIIEPLVVDLRGDFEEMLIQAAGSPTPDIYKQATRPREYNITTNSEGYPDTALSFTEDSNVTGYDVATVGENTRVLYGTNEESGMWLALRSGLILSDTLELPDTTIEIFRRAFAETFACHGSYSVNWAASPNLWAIDAGAFQASEIGGDLVLNENSHIGSYAFAGCTKLESVEAPGVSVYLDEAAFENCTRGHRRAVRHFGASGREYKMKEILLTSSVLILALLALRRLFRRTVSRRMQYALWLLVLVRLLVPVNVGTLAHNVLSAAAPVQTVVEERLDTPVLYVQ